MAQHLGGHLQGHSQGFHCGTTACTAGAFICGLMTSLVLNEYIPYGCGSMECFCTQRAACQHVHVLITSLWLPRQQPRNCQSQRACLLLPVCPCPLSGACQCEPAPSQHLPVLWARLPAGPRRHTLAARGQCHTLNEGEVTFWDGRVSPCSVWVCKNRQDKLRGCLMYVFFLQGGLTLLVL